MPPATCRRQRAGPAGLHPQAPPDRPRVAGLIEGVFGPAAREQRSASAGRRAERHRSETRPGGLRDRCRMVTMSALVVALVAGPGFEPG